MKTPRARSLLPVSVAVLAAACSRSENTPTAAAAIPPIDAELLALQGTWEGAEVDDRGTSQTPVSQEADKRKPGDIDLDFLKTGLPAAPPPPRGKITITVTGNTFHFHRDADFWFDTSITLPAGTEPKQLHATIKSCPPSQASSVGQVVVAIFRIEDGTLTLATGNGDGEAPQSFAESGLNRYELRRIPSPKESPGSPKGI